VLAVDYQDIDTSKPLHGYRVYSLLAAELRDWFARTFQADTAVFDTTGADSSTAMTDILATKGLSVPMNEEKSLGFRGRQ